MARSAAPLDDAGGGDVEGAVMLDTGDVTFLAHDATVPP
jgi:hypothetical protein